MSDDLDQAMTEMMYVLRRYRRLIVLVIVIIAAIWLLQTTFYSVEADQKGVVLRFGAHVRDTDPGLHAKLPWPIEEAIRVPVQRVQTVEFGFSTVSPGRRTQYATQSADHRDIARMLTGDLNLAHVEWIVQYRIRDAAKFLFQIAPTGRQSQAQAVQDIIRDVSESVLRKLVGDVSVDAVLTFARQQIATDAQIEIQEMLEAFDSGVHIVTVKLQSVTPPDPVKDAFDAVNRAKQNKERVVNEARGERNRLVPEARGKRDRTIKEAEGYRERIVKAGRGRANAFLAKLAEYEKAPEVTRSRLYLESMEEILEQVGEIVVIDDAVRGVLPLLNLNETLDSSAGRGGAR
jgi:membrane protease subunit HflK